MNITDQHVKWASDASDTLWKRAIQRAGEADTYIDINAAALDAFECGRAMALSEILRDHISGEALAVTAGFLMAEINDRLEQEIEEKK